MLYVVHRHYAMFTVNCWIECKKHKRSLSLSDKDALEVEVKDFAPIRRVWGVAIPKNLAKSIGLEPFLD